MPVVANDNPLRSKWGFHDEFVFGYSGNLGRAHEFATVLKAAEILRNNSRVIFLFVGGGTSSVSWPKPSNDADLQVLDS